MIETGHRRETATFSALYFEGNPRRKRSLYMPATASRTSQSPATGAYS